MVTPRNDVPYMISDPPGGLSAPTLLQPAVPTSQAEKARARCAANLNQTIMDLHQPPVPLPQHVQWTRSQAPMELTLTRSRMSLISDKIAAGG